MLFREKDMREPKLMIGILFGVRRSLWISCMRGGWNSIRGLIILGIIISCVGRICLFAILRNIGRIFRGTIRGHRRRCIIFIRLPIYFLPNMLFLLISLKDIKAKIRRKMYGSWNQSENLKEKAFFYLISFLRFHNGKIIQ